MQNYDKIKLQYPKRWTISMYNELGILASGVRYIIKSDTETFIIIHKHQVPVGIKATYANAVYHLIPLKYNPHHVQLTVWCNIIIYPGDTNAPFASLLD